MRFTLLVVISALTAGLYCQASGTGQDADPAVPQPPVGQAQPARPDAQPAPPPPAEAPGTSLLDRSYGLGFVVGEEIRTGLERDGVGTAKDLIAQGFRDGLNGGDPLVARERMDRVLLMLHEEMQARMVRRLLEESPEFRQLHDANLARSAQFHELFGRQEGVVTLPSGLQYKVLRHGSGPSPQPTDTVVLTGRITLLDGTVISEGENVEARVDTAVQGGIEALTLMRVGARWQVAIPPALAHGAGGRMPKIGPNETIVGVVELVAIK